MSFIELRLKKKSIKKMNT